MNTIQSLITQPKRQLDFNLYNRAIMQSTRIAATQQQEKDITIFTEDGDRVTISSNQQSQALYKSTSGFSQRMISGVYNNYAMVGINATESNEKTYQFDSNRHLNISVEGNLSEQEMEDIRKILNGIDQIITNLLQDGDVEKGLAMAMNLKDLESISGFSANYRLENTASIEQTSVDNITSDSESGLLGPVRPVKQEINNSIQNVIEDMFKQIRTSGIKTSKLNNPLKNLFARIRKSLLENRDSQHKIDLTNFIEKKLLERMEQMPV